MIQSSSSNYTKDIAEQFESFKKILPIFIGENVCNNLNNFDKKKLFEHQEFLYEYMKRMNKIPVKDLKQRGVLVFHRLGSGKSTTGIVMSEACRDYFLNPRGEDFETKKVYKRKVVLFIPANLLFDPWISEIASKCFKDCSVRDVVSVKLAELRKDAASDNKIKTDIIEILKSFNYHIIHYNATSIEGGMKDKLLLLPTRKTHNETYSNKISLRSNPLDDSVIIIDEAHNISNMISNKIKDNKDKPLYDMLMSCENSKVICLTGTPIVNQPFEIAILANIIRGPIANSPNIIFKLDHQDFARLFIDRKTIKNKNLLQRRLNGLISYYKGADEIVYAAQHIDDVLIPMSATQERGYNKAYQMEKEVKNMHDIEVSNEILNKIYRMKASNAVLPSYVYNELQLTKQKLKKGGVAITTKAIPSTKFLLDKTITPEMERQIISILDNDNKPLSIDNDLYQISRKIHNIVKKTMESAGPVMIFSRFEGIYGIKLITEALKQNGFGDYDDDKSGKSKNKFIIWTGKHRNSASKEVFNSDKNKDGSLIKVFCMTTSGKEGINLKGIRQVHLLEPWWNDVVARQVIARGIRICSHSHISKSEFDDQRLKQHEKTTNERIVNVFRYYAYPDMRYKLNKTSDMSVREYNEKKRIIISDMENSSFDHYIREIARTKQIMEDQMVDVMKNIAFDCEIHKGRNNDSNIECFVDEQYADYFDTWDIEDNQHYEYEQTRPTRIVNMGASNIIVDGQNNVYKPSKAGQPIIEKKDLVKIGKIINKEVIPDNANPEMLKVLEKPIEIKTTIIDEMLKIDTKEGKKKIVVVSRDAAKIQMLKKYFDNIVVFEVNKTLKKELKHLDVKFTKAKKDIEGDYVYIDNSFLNYDHIDFVNNLKDKKIRFILMDIPDVKHNNIIYAVERNTKKYSIFNSEMKNELVKLITDNFPIKSLTEIVEYFNTAKINTVEAFVKYVLLDKIETGTVVNTLKQTHIKKMKTISRKMKKMKK